MITYRQITSAQPVELVSIMNTLSIDKMKLDKFFSIFLEQYEMTEDNLDTPEWFTYREMSKEYERVSRLLKTADFYINQNA